MMIVGLVSLGWEAGQRAAPAEVAGGRTAVEELVTLAVHPPGRMLSRAAS
jgi:hypothetical protein